MKTTRIADTRCTNCAALVDAVSRPDENLPEPGSALICLHCSHLMILGQDGQARDPTDEEVLDLAGDPEVLRFMKVLAEARADYARQGRKRGRER